MGMTDELKDRRVAFVIANEGVEHVEFTNAEGTGSTATCRPARIARTCW